MTTFTLTNPTTAPKGLSLTFHGGEYPHPSTTVATPQSFNLTLLCATDTNDPTFSSYDGSQLRIEWSAPGGCAFQGDQPPENGGGGGTDDESQEKDRKKSVGSGVGWFFFA